MIHVGAPCSAPEILRKIPESVGMTDPSGFLKVDKNSLQHTKFPNIFGIGDCTNAPTSKTAAGVGKNLILKIS